MFLWHLMNMCATHVYDTYVYVSVWIGLEGSLAWVVFMCMYNAGMCGCVFGFVWFGRVLCVGGVYVYVLKEGGSCVCLCVSVYWSCGSACIQCIHPPSIHKPINQSRTSPPP